MAITPARQRNAVSEGMALGMILCDRNALRWDKLAVDLSFAGAWRSWQYRQRFPQVETDLRRGRDGIWVMTHANERKTTMNFFWDTGGSEIVIYPRSIWADGEVDAEEAASLIDGDLSATGWRELAADFLERLTR
ncbi:hypothetical protein [Rhodococcus ruber]|uniref:hypothetical protein n=1 Tax=Rhodococcus ruber TaxID=1830 RepID=UPI001F27484A|nr:hypothetical protein [Rhodococcus ruber]MCF8785243.1 hypothetical protein [Rhodococcus ruber]